MVLSCSAYGCTNRVKKGSNISFHSFPSNPLLCKRWVIAMKRDKFKPTKYSKLCSDHFQSDDFIYNFGKKSLKENTIPTVFKFPKHLIKAPSTERSKRLKSNVQKNEQLLVNTLSVVEKPDHNTEQQKCNQDLSENAIVAGPSVSYTTSKRKRSQPVYVGDVSSEDLEQPEKFKRLWRIAENTINRQKKMIMYLRTKVKRLQRKVNSLNDLIDHLKCGNKITPNCHSLLQEFIPKSEKQLLLRQLKLCTEKKFPPELRAFAVTLHFYSSAAYNYVRKTFQNCLPHPSTIRKWYSSIDGSPGYTAESLNAVKLKVDEFRKKNQTLVCSLMMDEMSIRQHVEWNGTSNIGYINFGFDSDSDSLPLAKQALVFLIVGVNCRWKLPIAYFLIDSLGAEERANLVKGCLVMLEDYSVKIVSLTFDGAASNFAMATILGANLSLNALKTYFIHPRTKEEVFIMLDVCHMLKLLRNALGEWGAFVDQSEKKILWQYFKDLVNLQEEEGLHLATKIRRRHINYHTEKMKVKLAAQVFSSSVADALEFCDKDLHLPNFKESDATVVFCRTIDKLFDILNTRNSLSKNPYKKPLSEYNIDFVRRFFKATSEYIISLRTLSGEQMVFSRRKAGFVGFLISMQSAQLIVEKYIIQKKYLSYLLCYKLSQDHLETFFSAIRSKGGFNNNPTSSQFAAAYKRLLVHAEITSSSSANCLPQDNTVILTASSVTKKKQISVTWMISTPLF